MTPPLTDDQQIRNLIDAWAEATAAGDLTALMPLMTDDVIFLTPGSVPIRRKDLPLTSPL
jgi:uncharacterized protein (TIGR02246 family)